MLQILSLSAVTLPTLPSPSARPAFPFYLPNMGGLIIISPSVWGSPHIHHTCGCSDFSLGVSLCVTKYLFVGLCHLPPVQYARLFSHSNSDKQPHRQDLAIFSTTLETKCLDFFFLSFFSGSCMVSFLLSTGSVTLKDPLRVELMSLHFRK